MTCTCQIRQCECPYWDFIPTGSKWDIAHPTVQRKKNFQVLEYIEQQINEGLEDGKDFTIGQFMYDKAGDVFLSQQMTYEAVQDTSNGLWYLQQCGA